MNMGDIITIYGIEKEICYGTQKNSSQSSDLDSSVCVTVRINPLVGRELLTTDEIRRISHPNQIVISSRREDAACLEYDNGGN